MNVADLRPDAERYQRFAEHYYPGHVSIRECYICGYLEWSSTGTKDPNGYSVSSGGNCQECYVILQRVPEIFAWVQNVVAHSMKSLLKEKK